MLSEQSSDIDIGVTLSLSSFMRCFIASRFGKERIELRLKFPERMPRVDGFVYESIKHLKEERGKRA